MRQGLEQHGGRISNATTNPIHQEKFPEGGNPESSKRGKSMNLDALYSIHYRLTTALAQRADSFIDEMSCRPEQCF